MSESQSIHFDEGKREPVTSFHTRKSSKEIPKALVITVRIWVIATLLGLAFVLGIGWFSAARANDIVVNTTTDEFDIASPNISCSLREAVVSANRNIAIGGCEAGDGISDTVLIPAGVFTITIAGRGEDAGETGDIDVTNPTAESLSIVGVAEEETLINGNGVDRVFDVAVAPVTIADLTITGGMEANGGGMRIRSPIVGGVVVTLSSVIISGNTITGTTALTTTVGITPDIGGGLFNYGGRVTIVNSMVTLNHSIAGGAGIGNMGVLELSNSKVLTNIAQSGAGGGIANDGTLFLFASQFQGNQALNPANLPVASAAGQGGAIFSRASVGLANVSIITSGFADNQAAEAGGALFADASDISIVQSTFTKNRAPAGGAVYNGKSILAFQGGTLESNSTISSTSVLQRGGAIFNNGILSILSTSLLSNYANDCGGALFNPTGAEATLFGATVTGNQATSHGGGVCNAGKLTSTSSLLQNNTSADNGGAIYNTQGAVILSTSRVVSNSALGLGGGIHNDSGGNLSIKNSVVISNISALNGGGLSSTNSNSIAITNTTFSQNRATGDGGGLSESSSDPKQIQLNNVTLAYNQADGSGGGIKRAGSGTITVANTLIANNLSAAGPDVSGALVSAGYNLVSDSSGLSFSGDITGNLLNLSANLEPLTADLFPYHPLAPSSPAIDAGNPSAPGGAFPACADSDQTGTIRPQSIQCDIGAIELDPALTPTSTPTALPPTATPTPTDTPTGTITPPTATPIPTDTPTGTITPPTATPIPTDTPTGTITPPTATPTPTDTPTGTITPPTATPTVTSTLPIGTLASTITPSATDNPLTPQSPTNTPIPGNTATATATSQVTPNPQTTPKVYLPLVNR